MTPTPEQIAAAVERTELCIKAALEIQDFESAAAMRVLVKALAAAQEDTRRLDWLESCPKDVYFDYERPIGEVSLKLFSKEDPMIFTATTARAAIDAAARGEGKTK